MKSKRSGLRSRREFVRDSLASSAAALLSPAYVPSLLLRRQASSGKIHIGVIGCGRIAREHDMPGILKFEGARIIAVCDVDSKRCAEGGKFVEAYYAGRGICFNGVRTYSDYRELLENKDVDGVVIATPDHWHAKPAIDAVKAGKDVYLEKPGSLTIAEGRAMSDAVRATNRVFQFGTQQRSWEQFRVAAELVRNGRIGRLHTIRIGLPTDPAGNADPEMPVPDNLDYDTWLGSTPRVYYTEKRVHPQNDYSRPGWLRCEQFGAGMITGWGVHHVDIAQWGMDAELSGPIEIEATAEFPVKGLWDVHGKFSVKAKYADGTTLFMSDEYPNGIRFEGSEGWIFVTRGSYSVTSTDPISKDENGKVLSASDPRVLRSEVGAGGIQLYRSKDHHGNWLDCMRSRKQTICPVEAGHRSTSTCLLSHIAMKLRRRLEWNPEIERFKNDDEANRFLSRPQRAPYHT